MRTRTQFQDGFENLVVLKGDTWRAEPHHGQKGSTFDVLPAFHFDDDVGLRLARGVQLGNT